MNDARFTYLWFGRKLKTEEDSHNLLPCYCNCTVWTVVYNFKTFLLAFANPGNLLPINHFQFNSVWTDMIFSHMLLVLVKLCFPIRMFKAPLLRGSVRHFAHLL